MEIPTLKLAGRLEHMVIGRRVPGRATWERLFKGWSSVMDEYAARSSLRNDWARLRGGDLAYWNEEKANVGFLAAAVWRSGGAAVQEFEVTRPTGPGKGDLWFKLDDLSCQIEAKDTVSAHTSNPTAGKVQVFLEEAGKQLSELPSAEKAPLGLAVVFVVPGVSGVSFDFLGLIQQLENDCGIGAVYRPGRYSSVQDEEDGLNYPGVACVGRLMWGALQDAT